MENETTFTVEEVREALTEALKEDFLSNTNAFEQNTLGEQHEEIFRRDHESEIFNQIVEESVERFLENDSKIDTDLETFVANEIANADYDTNEVLNEYLVDTVDWTINTNDQDWIDSFSNGEDIREGSLDYQFTNDFVIIEDKSSFDGEVYDRQEGIEKALENGFDLDKLIEVTSESEVLEAARNVSDFEVIDAYELQNEATEKVVELLVEEAKEFGLEINADNLNAVVADVINQDYVSSDSGIADTINNSDIDSDNVKVIDNNEPEVILNTENMSREELVEAIAASLYEDNKEALQEKVNNGETFELSQFDKSEVNFSDTMESFNSKAENAELSKDNEGQKSTDSVKQK